MLNLFRMVNAVLTSDSKGVQHSNPSILNAVKNPRGYILWFVYTYNMYTHTYITVVMYSLIIILLE